MKTCRSISLATILDDIRHSSKVNDKVLDLAIKLVLVDVPFGTISIWNIDVRINKCNACKCRQTFNGWSVVGISNKLGIVKSERLSLSLTVG